MSEAVRPARGWTAVPTTTGKRSQQGFSYLGVLFLIALMGATLALTGVSWHAAQKREKERELLFVGNQFRQAIAAYYERSPGSVKQYPKALNELLKDPRQLATARYLRRIYRDPVSGKTEWGLVKTRDDRIMGVYSLSEDEPVKKGNFREADKDFEGKARYADWRFVHVPPQPVTPPGAAASKPLLAVAAPPLAPSPAPVPGPDAQNTFNEAQCESLLRNDAAVCQAMAAKYGADASASCVESADARFTQCRDKRTVFGLTPLKVQAEAEIRSPDTQ